MIKILIWIALSLNFNLLCFLLSKYYPKPFSYSFTDTHMHWMPPDLIYSSHKEVIFYNGCSFIAYFDNWGTYKSWEVVNGVCASVTKTYVPSKITYDTSTRGGRYTLEHFSVIESYLADKYGHDIKLIPVVDALEIFKKLKEDQPPRYF